MSAPVAERASEQRVITPSGSRVIRRSVFWVAAGAFALIVAIIGITVAGGSSSGGELDPTNPGPAGTQALVEVLREQGVTVTVTSNLTATRTATHGAQSTLLIYDPDVYLDHSQRVAAYAFGSHLVLVEPDFDQLADLDSGLAVDSGIAQAGKVTGPAEAGCDLPAATRAGSITADGQGYRSTNAEADATLCFGTGDKVYSLIRVTTQTGDATVLGASGALTNEHIAERGNAALALNLLGGASDLVWYQPSEEDLSGDAQPTIGELSPGWVLPLTALIVITTLAAAFWRGRRFGPLIVENLPVTVRANETMRGRARLYEKSGARLRALDSLRVGAVARLARALGLPRLATVDDVAASAAAVTGRPVPDVRRILLDAQPASDRDLVRLSDELSLLERTVAQAITPS